MKSRIGSVVIGLGIMLGSPASQAAEYTVGVEPSFAPDFIAEVYQPLMDYLGEATGHTFILQVPQNYHALWRDVRADAPMDFVFEDAHLADYRITRFGFTPLARTIQPTRFTLIALPQVADLGPSGLVGRRVVSMPAPSLGSALLGDIYPNPIAQPEIESSAASWRDGVEMVFADEASAAMVPDYIANLYPNLLPVSESREFPGRAFLAAPTVPEDVRRSVREALLALGTQDELYTVLDELGITGFQPTSAAEYEGSEEMLRAFFGYREN